MTLLALISLSTLVSTLATAGPFAEIRVLGPYDQIIVEQVLDHASADLAAACWAEAELDRGEATLEMTVLRGGATESVEAIDPGPLDEAGAACLIDALQAATFPRCGWTPAFTVTVLSRPDAD